MGLTDRQTDSMLDVFSLSNQQMLGGRRRDKKEIRHRHSPFCPRTIRGTRPLHSFCSTACAPHWVLRWFRPASLRRFYLERAARTTTDSPTFCFWSCTRVNAQPARSAGLAVGSGAACSPSSPARGRQRLLRSPRAGRQPSSPLLKFPQSLQPWSVERIITLLPVGGDPMPGAREGTGAAQ